MAMDGLAELLSDCWTASGLWRVVGRCWLDFGCHVAAQSGSEIWKLSKKVLLQEAEGSKVVFDGFLSKTALETTKSVFELRNPNIKCISAFST